MTFINVSIGDNMYSVMLRSPYKDSHDGGFEEITEWHPEYFPSAKYFQAHGFNKHPDRQEWSKTGSANGGKSEQVTMIHKCGDNNTVDKSKWVVCETDTPPYKPSYLGFYKDLMHLFDKTQIVDYATLCMLVKQHDTKKYQSTQLMQAIPFTLDNYDHPVIKTIFDLAMSSRDILIDIGSEDTPSTFDQLPGYIIISVDQDKVHFDFIVTSVLYSLYHITLPTSSQVNELHHEIKSLNIDPDALVWIYNKKHVELTYIPELIGREVEFSRNNVFTYTKHTFVHSDKDYGNTRIVGTELPDGTISPSTNLKEII